MTATTSQSPAALREPGEPSSHGVSFAGILAGEWIKLRSLRSTWWVTGAIFPVTLLLAFVIAANLPDDFLAQARGDRGAALVAQAVGAGLIFPQLIIVVLGTLAITSEFGTGMIRSSFAAVPSRVALIAGKAIVVGVAAFAIGAVSAALSWAVAVPLLARRGASVTFGEPAIVLWSVLGMGAVLGLTAVFALGVGTVVRSSAGALSVSVGVLFVLTIILQVIASVSQSDAVQAAQAYLLSSASSGAVGMPNGDLAEWQSLLVVIAWAALAFAIGLLVARRRDV